MNRQVLTIVIGAVVLFAAALGGSLAFIGRSNDGGGNVHTMPAGQTMTGDMHTMSDGSTMTGMTMP